MVLSIILSINCILLLICICFLYSRLTIAKRNTYKAVKVAKKSVSTLSNLHNVFVAKYGISKIPAIDQFCKNMYISLEMDNDDFETAISIKSEDIV